MSAEPKLPRWTEPGADVPGELSELLRAGRAPLGTEQEVAQLGQSLGQLLGPGAGLSAAGPSASLTAPAASAGLSLLRWAGWAAAGLGGAAALWYFSADTAPPPARSPAPPAAQVAPPPVPPEPVAAQPPPLVEPEVVEPPSAAPERPRAPTRTPAGSTEVELLRRAQAALATQPERALALTSQHQRRFRGGALAEEREALAIEALRRLGRIREAQRRAALFQQRYPHSVHTQRVLGSGAVPGGR